MSEHRNENMHSPGEHPKRRNEMSRRQFLTYTLGGTGGFLAAGMLTPMIRFAIDPVLKPKGAADWVKVVEVSKVKEEPTSFSFTHHQVDGWYESDVELQAWIAKDANGKIFALSPVCKHLGCTVNWNGNPSLPNQYFCPCHGAHYTKDGKNLAVAPLPLDEYDVKVENGFVYLGKIKPNTRVKA